MREQRLERRVVTALFVDVVGSTTLTLELGPERVKRALDRAFSELAALIAAEGGTVEKYIGDAIHALFGVPATHPDDPQRALRAAHACVRVGGRRSHVRAPRGSGRGGDRRGHHRPGGHRDRAPADERRGVRQRRGAAPAGGGARPGRRRSDLSRGDRGGGRVRRARGRRPEGPGTAARMAAGRPRPAVRPGVACPSWGASPSSRSSSWPTGAPDPGVACWPWSPVRPARGRPAWSRSSSRDSARSRASSRRGVAPPGRPRRGVRSGSCWRQSIPRRPSRSWRRA